MYWRTSNSTHIYLSVDSLRDQLVKSWPSTEKSAGGLTKDALVCADPRRYYFIEPVVFSSLLDVFVIPYWVHSSSPLP